MARAAPKRAHRQAESGSEEGAAARPSGVQPFRRDHPSHRWPAHDGSRSPRRGAPCGRSWHQGLHRRFRKRAGHHRQRRRNVDLHAVRRRGAEVDRPRDRRGIFPRGQRRRSQACLRNAQCALRAGEKGDRGFGVAERAFARLESAQHTQPRHCRSCGSAASAAAERRPGIPVNGRLRLAAPRRSLRTSLRSISRPGPARRP